jgi:hypothetical protein
MTFNAPMTGMGMRALPATALIKEAPLVAMEMGLPLCRALMRLRPEPTWPRTPVSPLAGPPVVLKAVVLAPSWLKVL